MMLMLMLLMLMMLMLLMLLMLMTLMLMMLMLMMLMLKNKVVGGDPRPNRPPLSRANTAPKRLPNPLRPMINKYQTSNLKFPISNLKPNPFKCNKYSFQAQRHIP